MSCCSRSRKSLSTTTHRHDNQLKQCNRRPRSLFTSTATILGPPPIFPLPFVPVLLTTGATLIVTNTRIFLESILQRELCTTVTIKSLNVNPFTLEAAARNIQLTDRKTGPLLSLSKLSFNYIQKEIPEKSQKRRQLQISASGATITAAFEGTDLRQTNWLSFAERVSKRNGETNFNATEQKKSSEIAIKAPSIELILMDTIVALRQADTGLSLNVGVGTVRVESGSIEKAIRATDAVIGEALRKVGTGSLPKTVREGARRRIREEMKRTARLAARKGAVHVKRFKGTVEQAERFIEGMPDTEGVRSWLRGTRNILKGVEGLLKDVDDEDEEDQSSRDDRTRVEERDQEQEEVFDISDYRELDES